MGDPIQFRLRDETVAKLALPYTPYHWPYSGNPESEVGFEVAEPFKGHKETKWYAEQQERYDRLQALLAPHQEEWVEIDCVAALIPLESGCFAVQINGVEFNKSPSGLIDDDALRRRMIQRKLPIQVTTCSARIFGGGRLKNGGKRNYGIALGLEPFPIVV